MILLSFDTEEFDVPREHGVDFSLEEGMKVSVEGTNRILDVLKQNGVKATFFCTGNFAEHAPERLTSPVPRKSWSVSVAVRFMATANPECSPSAIVR